MARGGDRPRKHGGLTSGTDALDSGAASSCGGVGLFVYRLTCSDCGEVQSGEVVMPTFLAPGAVTTMYGSCLCGAEAEGRARFVEMLNVF
jgi:hypothetical protein